MKRKFIIILITLIFPLYTLQANETLNIIPDAATTSIAGFSDNFNESIWSIYNNQANIGTFSYNLISFSYKRLMNLFNFVNLASGFKLKYGYVGVGLSFMDYGSDSLITSIDAATGLPVGGEEFYSYDLLFVTAYGYEFEKIGFSSGIGIKLLQNSIANRDLLYSVIDFSFLKDIGDFRANLNIRNINLAMSSLSDIPLSINMNLLIPSSLFSKSKTRYSYFIPGINFDLSDSILERVYGSLGVKIFLNRKVDLSGGMYIGKNNEFLQLNSLGIGYKIKRNILLNYSFSRESTYTEFTHCFTLQYVFKSKFSRKKSSKSRSWELDDIED